MSRSGSLMRIYRSYITKFATVDESHMFTHETSSNHKNTLVCIFRKKNTFRFSVPRRKLPPPNRELVSVSTLFHRPFHFSAQFVPTCTGQMSPGCLGSGAPNPVQLQVLPPVPPPPPPSRSAKCARVFTNWTQRHRWSAETQAKHAGRGRAREMAIEKWRKAAYFGLVNLSKYTHSRVPIKNESRIFWTALSEILWGDEKTTYAKFECNRSIFRGGASRFYGTIGLP